MKQDKVIGIILIVFAAIMYHQTTLLPPALFGDVGLYCYDFEGKQIWSHRIEAKKSLMNYGAAASPVICGDLVIMVYDNMEDRYIAAFDASTGECGRA